VERYSLEFKLKAVKLSQLKGVEVQAVADALEIHPFMLSRWRKEARDGVLRGRVSLAKAVKTPSAGEMKRFQALKRAHALLQEEHALLKNSSGSPPHESRRLRVHRPRTRDARCDAAVPALRGHAGRVLCVAWTAGEGAREAGPDRTRRETESREDPGLRPRLMLVVRRTEKTMIRVKALALVASILLLLAEPVSGNDRGEVAKVNDVAFKAGQLWTYQTRKHEPKSRILIQRVELDPKAGEIVHIRVLNLSFRGPKGSIAEIPHLPYSGPALRKCLVALESSGNRVPSDYEAGYKIWREAFDAGKGGIFTLDVAGVLDGMEKATGH